MEFATNPKEAALGDPVKTKKVQKRSIKRKQKAPKKKSPFSTLRLLRRSLLFQTKEFFDNSTLHGVRYIAEEGRPFFERFMWFCFVAVGAVAAIIIIFSLWEKFQTNPTITGLDTDFHNQQVIFPTVLVCPTKPFDEDAVKLVAHRDLGVYEAGSEKYQPFVELLTQLSYDKLKLVTELLRGLLNSTTLPKADLRNLAFKVSVRCNDTFASCHYKDEETECCDIFRPIYTEHGFCFAFNARYINSLHGETLNPNINVLFETDKKWALTFGLLHEANVFVHSHNEISGWDFQPQVLWDNDSVVEFLISMKQTYTTEDARQLSIGQRKCIFPDEVKLQYYRDEYTFTGCMKECRISKCLKFCRCVPPYYAPPVSLQFCTPKDFACLYRYRDNITSISSCQHCELGCHNTVYDIEKYSKVLKTDEEQQDALVTIEYLTWPIIRYKREVLFGWVDLLVSFGGIAGLFLGFSLLSAVEIIYFFTMRAFCMLYKNRDDLITIEQEETNRPQTVYELGLKPVQRAATVPVSSDEHQAPIGIVDKRSVSVGLVENEFRAKADRKRTTEPGLLLSNRRTERLHKLKQTQRLNLFRPVQIAPYSESIKPLDKKMIRNKDGLFYDGYLP